MVRRLRPDDLNSVRRFVRLLKNRPYAFYPKERLDPLAFNLERTLLGSDLDIQYGLFDKQSLQAVGIVTRSPFDEEHFGIKMAHLNWVTLGATSFRNELSLLLERCLQQAREAGIQHLATRVSASDMLGAQIVCQKGFFPTGVSITFIAHPDEIKAARNSLKVQTAKPEDAKRLERLASAIHFPSRYAADSLLPRRRVLTIHARWAANTVRGRCDCVFLALKNDEPVGFIALNTIRSGRRKVGVIDLVGVHPRVQGKGIGKHLLYETKRYFSKKCHYVQVSCYADNDQATYFYHRSGFTIFNTTLTLHYRL